MSEFFYTCWWYDPVAMSHMSDEWYGVAQVCRNGHVRNPASKEDPGLNEKFCADCGAPTMTKCDACGGAIRGALYILRYEQPQNVGGLRRGDAAPYFCENCGKPYPWTQTRLEAARQLAMEMDALTPEDRELLGRNLDDRSPPIVHPRQWACSRSPGNTPGSGPSA